MAPKPTTVSLKLLIDPRSQRVIFAEAGKDVVDFLFQIMSLLVANLIRLLGKLGTVGCIGNIYESIENLEDSFMQSKEKKDMLLKPMVTNYAPNVALLLPSIQFSRCTNLYSSNSNPAYVNLAFGAPSSDQGGCVKVEVPYMIMDDLAVMPMSAKSIFTLLNKFNIKDVSDLEVKVIAFGVNEGVKLLGASLRSKTALTTVFVGGN